MDEDYFCASINVVMIISGKVRRRRCLNHLLMLFVQGLIKSIY